MNIQQSDTIEGLSDSQVQLLRLKHGKNISITTDSHRFLKVMAGIVSEPMFVLLVIACSLYFILGSISEGIMMAMAMLIVSAISVYQERKSSRALESLKKFTEPRVTVIREKRSQEILSEELVPGDIMLLEKGIRVPADAVLLQKNDLSVNESLLTGESLAVEKTLTGDQSVLYQGTTIESGKCVARVTQTGNNTQLAKIGKSIKEIEPQKTRLQRQVNYFVKRLALFGILAFLLIFFINYYHYREFATSLLFALTLAMSVMPEEIPVALSSFMALGAYRMSKIGIISRQPQVIESLGAVTVICLDKTGTITENKMKVKCIYEYSRNSITEINETNPGSNGQGPLFFAALASESDPFDPMEKAILETTDTPGNAFRAADRRMVFEYPLEGTPPMMTHVYASGKTFVAAAKGAPERILSACSANAETSNRIKTIIQDFAGKGYRVLGVASATHSDSPFPVSQDDFHWQFEGLVALYDPPKKNSGQVIKSFRDAGIEIKLLTGDHPGTAINIAGQVGIKNESHFYTGKEVMNMTESALQSSVKNTTVFARMFPQAKLRVINALKANHETVAMTGDGVNDGPALKASDIGIAMGKKGTETAKQASDLVVTDDDLEKMVTAIKEGRKIYSNLIKAVRYIISIHIPIILTAALPVVLGWQFPNIFTPIHVIFLELIMGPTCSIFFEREPVEENIMQLPSPKKNAGLFTKQELITCIIQGIIISAGVLLLFYLFMNNGSDIKKTRMIVFTTLILSNVFLTFVNRSFTRTIIQTIRYKNPLSAIILMASAGFLSALHFIPAVRDLFQLAPIDLSEFFTCLVVALIAVGWFEIYKGLFRGWGRVGSR